MRSALFLMIAGAPLAAPAMAQTIDVGASLDVASDLRERGLSASGGRASGAAGVSADLGGLRAEARARALRGSARHGGADLGLELAASYRFQSGGWRLDAGGVFNAFGEGRGALDYGEVFVSAGYTLGPAELSASAFYAPDQRTIGGDNLYLRLRAEVGVPGSAWTLSAHAGRSGGSVDDPVRSARLRPAGAYTDWSLGAEWSRGPVVAGLRYSDTDIARRRVVSPWGDARHNGAALTASVGVWF